MKRRALEINLSVEQILDMVFEDHRQIRHLEKETVIVWEKDIEILTTQEVRDD